MDANDRPLLVTSGDIDSHYEMAAESLKGVFGSEHEKKIFLEISKRYCTRESALEAEKKRRAAAADRIYYTSFRQDALRLVHSEQNLAVLLQKQVLSLGEYRAGLEMAYPMFYLSVGILMFGTERIKFFELHVPTAVDPDTRLSVKHFFIRSCGFTFLELLTFVPGHELFDEDPTLGKFRDHVKQVVNTRVGELVSLSFKEENDLCPKERMNKAKVLGDFFEKRSQYCYKGHAPRGGGTFQQWAMTPGTAASCFGEAVMMPWVPPDPGATVQMERCEKLVMTTLMRLLRRWLLLGAQQASPDRWVEGLC